jgi:hypothetical protein
MSFEPKPNRTVAALAVSAVLFAPIARAQVCTAPAYSLDPGGAEPTISGLAAAVYPTGVFVSWTTDVPAGSEVLYGINYQYTNRWADPTLRVDHGTLLTGLGYSTTYTYRVFSAGATRSGTFQTAPPPAPVISNVVVAPRFLGQSDLLWVGWTTDIPADSALETWNYFNGWERAFFDGRFVTTHGSYHNMGWTGTMRLRVRSTTPQGMSSISSEYSVVMSSLCSGSIIGGSYGAGCVWACVELGYSSSRAAEDNTCCCY